MIPGFTGLLIFFIILFPVPGHTQTGGDSAEALKRIFESRGIRYEEHVLFPVFERGGGSGPPDAESSILVRFRRTLTPAPEGETRSPAETDGGAPPLFIAAFPLGETPDQGEALPYRFRTALELIEKIRSRAAGGALPADMIIAFLGDGDFRAVKTRRNRSGLEFADYSDIIEDPEQTLFLYLDLGESPQSIFIHYGTPGTIAPLRIIENLPKLWGSLGVPAAFAVPFTELYKLRFAAGPELLRFVQEQEISGLYFSGRPLAPAGRGSGGIIPEDSLAELIFRYAGSVAIPGKIPDYHYTILPLPGTPLFLSQERIILLILLTAGSFFAGFLCYLGFRRPPPARLRIFIRCFWVIPAFLFLLLVCFTGAGLFTALLFKRGEETGIPLIYGWAGFKLLLAMGIFFLFTLPLRGYRIPRKANFYGAGAFLIIVLDAFIAAWADIVLTPFFIGALIVMFLGMVIKFPIPVFFCAFLAPFYGVLALLSAIRSGSGAMGEYVLSNNLFHTLMTALIFLPFILFFKRGLALLRQGKPRLPLHLSLIPPMLPLAAAGVLAVFLVSTS
jgi:hypothetical protein